MSWKPAVIALVLAAAGAFALLAALGSGGARAGILEITLDPATATNDVGSDHTVTATVTNVPPGELVLFDVVSGPNAGTTFTCSPNADCTTDDNLEVSMTYTGDGGVGQDTIEACVQILTVGQAPCATATKDWEEPPTPTPTPTPAPTATPTQAPAAQLPETGSQPPGGSDDIPWLAVSGLAMGIVAVAAAGLLLGKRAR